MTLKEIHILQGISWNVSQHPTNQLPSRCYLIHVFSYFLCFNNFFFFLPQFSFHFNDKLFKYKYIVPKQQKYLFCNTKKLTTKTSMTANRPLKKIMIKFPLPPPSHQPKNMSLSFFSFIMLYIIRVKIYRYCNLKNYIE